MRRAGFTLIELTIALAIAAMAMAAAVVGAGAVTDADLRSAAVDLTGAVKLNYDRAVMLKRTQRLAMNLDQGLWWIDYTEDRYALSRERAEGEHGKSSDEVREELEEDSSFFDDDVDHEVKAAVEGGAAMRFSRDGELDAGKPRPLPKGICFSRAWTGHQEEPFSTGVAYVHFFPGGWTEPARIELVDVDCESKSEADKDSSYITLRVLPLTGRVRSYHRQMEEPEVDEDDGRDEGDL